MADNIYGEMKSLRAEIKAFDPAHYASNPREASQELERLNKRVSALHRKACTYGVGHEGVWRTEIQQAKWGLEMQEQKLHRLFHTTLRKDLAPLYAKEMGELDALEKDLTSALQQTEGVLKKLEEIQARFDTVRLPPPVSEEVNLNKSLQLVYEKADKLGTELKAQLSVHQHLKDTEDSWESFSSSKEISEEVDKAFLIKQGLDGAHNSKIAFHMLVKMAREGKSLAFLPQKTWVAYACFWGKDPELRDWWKHSFNPSGAIFFKCMEYQTVKEIYSYYCRESNLPNWYVTSAPLFLHTYCTRNKEVEQMSIDDILYEVLPIFSAEHAPWDLPIEYGMRLLDLLVTQLDKPHKKLTTEEWVTYTKIWGSRLYWWDSSWTIPATKEFPKILKGSHELLYSMPLETFNQIYPGNAKYNIPMLLEALVTEDIDTFSNIFQEFVLSTLRVYDQAGDRCKRTYEALVLGMVVSLKGRYEVKSKRNSDFHQHDVILIPNNKDDLGIILGVGESATVSQHIPTPPLADTALQHIETKQYASELIERGIKRILYLTIVFYENKIDLIPKIVIP